MEAMAAGTYTLTLDGLRNLQMIAHGFVVVGLFYALKIFRRCETRVIAEMGWLFVRYHQNFFDVLILVLGCFSFTLTLLENSPFCTVFPQINIWYAILGGTTIILGAYYMLKMFQHAMLEKQIQSHLLM
jgi:NADH-quinone oxidoreductase subunit M